MAPTAAIHYRTVVGTNVARHAAQDEQVGKRVDHVDGFQLPSDPDRQALSNELVDDVEHAKALSLVSAILEEVGGPDMIGMFRPKPEAGVLVAPQPPALRLLVLRARVAAVILKGCFTGTVGGHACAMMRRISDALSRSGAHSAARRRGLATGKASIQSRTKLRILECPARERPVADAQLGSDLGLRGAPLGDLAGLGTLARRSTALWMLWFHVHVPQRALMRPRAHAVAMFNGIGTPAQPLEVGDASTSEVQHRPGPFTNQRCCNRS